MPWFVKLEEGVVTAPAFDRFLPDQFTWVRELERLWAITRVRLLARVTPAEWQRCRWHAPVPGP